MNPTTEKHTTAPTTKKISKHEPNGVRSSWLGDFVCTINFSKYKQLKWKTTMYRYTFSLKKSQEIRLSQQINLYAKHCQCKQIVSVTRALKRTPQSFSPLHKIRQQQPPQQCSTDAPLLRICLFGSFSVFSIMSRLQSNRIKNKAANFVNEPFTSRKIGAFRIINGGLEKLTHRANSATHNWVSCGRGLNTNLLKLARPV